MARPELPNSYIIDLDKIVNEINEDVNEYKHLKNKFTNSNEYADIVIPVWSEMEKDIADYLVFVHKGKIYISKKSSMVRFIKIEKGNNHYYLYDGFKNRDRRGYKKKKVKVRYPEEGVEPIYIPVYWRIN